MNLATIIEEHPDGHTALVVGAERIGYGRLRADVAASEEGARFIAMVSHPF